MYSVRIDSSACDGICSFADSNSGVETVMGANTGNMDEHLISGLRQSIHKVEETTLRLYV